MWLEDDNDGVVTVRRSSDMSVKQVDAGRMESTFYPELAKRMMFADPKSGHSQFKSREYRHLRSHLEGNSC